MSDGSAPFRAVVSGGRPSMVNGWFARPGHQRQPRDPPGLLNAGGGAHGIERAMEQGQPLLVRVVRSGGGIVRLRQPQPRGQHAIRDKARIDAVRAHETG
jgi:hypothetical protein